MNKLIASHRISLALWASIALSISLGAQPTLASPVCASHPNVKSMEKTEIVDEMAAIREVTKEIQMYHAEGDAIQLNPPCSVHWLSYTTAIDDHTETLEYYSEKRDALVKKGEASLAKFRACFTAQLATRPKIYNHDLTPAHSIDQYEANLTKLENKMSHCKLAARFKDLSDELKRQQAQ